MTSMGEHGSRLGMLVVVVKIRRAFFAQQRPLRNLSFEEGCAVPEAAAHTAAPGGAKPLPPRGAAHFPERRWKHRALRRWSCKAGSDSSASCRAQLEPFLDVRILGAFCIAIAVDDNRERPPAKVTRLTPTSGRRLTLLKQRL